MHIVPGALNVIQRHTRTHFFSFCSSAVSQQSVKITFTERTHVPQESGGQTFSKRGEVGEELEGEVGEDKSETFPVREEEKQVPATTSLEYKAAASESKSKS